MGLMLPFLSGSIFGLPGVYAILRTTARQPQDPREVYARTRVYAMDYSNVGSLDICGKVLHLFAKFTFLSSQL